MSEEQVEDPVAQPSAEYTEMAEKWALVSTLMGGTKAMREAGKTYLPQYDAESKAAYEARLQGAFLHNMFGDAVREISAKPFQKPITVEGDLPEELDVLEKNCDNRGTALTKFFKPVYKGGVSHGIDYVYVDMPVNPEKKIGNRPYFSFYSAECLLDAIQERSEKTGMLRLKQIRLKESRTEYKGFKATKISVIRVVNAPEFDEEDKPIEGSKGTVEIWEKRPGEKKHTQKSTVEHDYPGIPFEPYDPGKSGEFFAEPPLMDLAWNNVDHWQTRADQRNILHFARTYQPVVFGASKDELESIEGVGVNAIWFFADTDAHAEILEHSGASIKAGAEDILEIERRGRELAGEPLTRPGGGETATGRAIDEGRSQSQAQQWAEELGAFIARLYMHAAVWLGVELPDDFKVKVFDDFGLTARRGEDLQHLREMAKTGKLSDETLLRETKKRGVLGEELDVDQELERIKAQGPNFNIIDDIPEEDE